MLNVSYERSPGLFSSVGRNKRVDRAHLPIGSQKPGDTWRQVGKYT